jgi:hypothetical protein
MNDAGEQDEKRSADEESVPTASAESAMVGLGEQIGRYKLLRVLGEGGFGIVCLAQQEHPIRRQVALKIIKPGMDSAQVIRRFEAERQTLALLGEFGGHLTSCAPALSVVSADSQRKVERHENTDHADCSSLPRRGGELPGSVPPHRSLGGCIASSRRLRLTALGASNTGSQPSHGAHRALNRPR